LLDYSILMASLKIDNVRELEDLIIDCIYNELIEGQLDQRGQQFHVTQCFGRDMRVQDIDGCLAKLEDWDRQLEEAQVFMEKEIVAKGNKNVQDNYTRQVKESEAMAKRREEVITDMQAQSDPSNKKKHSGNQEFGIGGIKSMFKGLAHGFLK
jgi:COP9 signalosome complex subunit 7